MKPKSIQIWTTWKIKRNPENQALHKYWRKNKALQSQIYNQMKPRIKKMRFLWKFDTLESTDTFDDSGSATFTVHIDFQNDGDCRRFLIAGGIVVLRLNFSTISFLLVVVIIVIVVTLLLLRNKTETANYC